MLLTHPTIMLNMDTFIFPTDWKIFSKDTAMEMTTENSRTIRA